MARGQKADGKPARPGFNRTTKTKKARKAPESKRRAAERSQNAFTLEGSDQDSDSAIEVKAEDDEEIDSDEAFESGDEDKFGTFKFSGSQFLKRQQKLKAPVRKQGSSKQSERPLEIDLNEDSDSHPLPKRASSTQDDSDSESQSDFEDDTGADLMDLSKMLDNGPMEADDESEELSQDGSSSYSDEADVADNSHASDSSQEEQASEDSDADSASDSGSDDALADDALENFVSQIQQKRKRDEMEQTTKPVNGTVSKKRSRGMEDNEQVPESEHNLNLASTQTKLGLDTLMASLSGSRNAKVLKKTQTLQAPLAKPIQDRLNRSAAYDTVKEQITKWQPAVRQMREADVLKFPLNEPAQTKPNNNSLAASFKPSNELESQISGILKESGMQSEKSISKFEDLEMAKLTQEEVKKRRADLAIMRDLLFRQEQKAKRQSKIKSKAYRRVHRKEKQQAKLAMAEDDPEEVARSNEVRRARERMDLRHKNTGKWAQKMIGRADHGEGSRAAITEQLKRGEDLERKIRGIDDHSDDESSGYSGDGDHDEGVLSQDEPLPEKGVFSMKFMRDADAKEAEELARGFDSDDESMSSEDQDDRVDNNDGRRAFKPLTNGSVDANSRKAAAKQDRSHAKNKAEKTTEHVFKSDTSKSDTSKAEQDIVESSEDYNPWLTETKAPRKKRDTIFTKDSDGGLKFAAKLNKKKSAPLHAGRINGPVLDVNRTLPLKVQADSDHDETEDVARGGAGGQVVLKQLDLVAQAFAGDDVVAEFEAAKDSVVAEDAPQDIDETLPGWGSWVGTGVKKSSRNAKKFIKHVDGIKSESRKDAKLQHVVINEKRMKQAKSYMSQSVPFPFETKEQYERSLNLPIGPEFTTRTNFQKQIMPRVVTKQGKVVAPMDKPFKD